MKFDVSFGTYLYMQTWAKTRNFMRFSLKRDVYSNRHMMNGNKCEPQIDSA